MSAGNTTAAGVITVPILKVPGSGVAVGGGDVGLGVWVNVGTRVGTVVQVGGRADIAVALMVEEVGEGWRGGGAEPGTSPQAVKRRIKKESNKMVIDLGIVLLEMSVCATISFLVCEVILCLLMLYHGLIRADAFSSGEYLHHR